MIVLLPQRIDTIELLLGGRPSHLVDSRCVFALVLCHSLHGKGFAAERVGQQMLKRFDFSPSAFLRCLHDTGLEPTHGAVD